MNINQAIARLQELKAQGFIECRCLDDFTGTSEDVQFEVVMIDSIGNIVDKFRQKSVVKDPYERTAYASIYNEDEYWKKIHPTFEDFYQMMEGDRLKEVELVNSARPIIMVGAKFLPMT